MYGLNNFIPLKESPAHYEAYLYKVVFDHDKIKKYYIGYRKGLFDGTYKGSPKTHEKEFYMDLGKYDYKVYALDFGTAKNMIYEEKLMLNEAKTNGNWDEYYNESTGGGAKLKNYNKTVNEVLDGVENGEFDTRDIPKEVVHKYRLWQVRKVQKISGQVKKLKILISDSDGKWLDEHHKGVLVLENYDGKGKHVRIGSNHTIEASLDVKQVSTLKVIFIPEKLHKNLKEHEIMGIGQWDNPPDNEPRLETEIIDSAEFIVKGCDEEGIDPYHVSFREKFTRDGYSPSQIKYRMDKAKDILEDRSLYDVGDIQINYDDKKSEDHKRLMDKLKSYSGCAFVGAAGQPRGIIHQLMEELFNNRTQTKFKVYIKVITEIGSYKKSKKYDSIEHNLLRERFDFYQEQFRTKDNKKITIEIEKLDVTKPNPLYLT